jgi:predicted Zn-dependent protease with MMP-like domain
MSRGGSSLSRRHLAPAPPCAPAPRVPATARLWDAGGVDDQLPDDDGPAGIDPATLSAERFDELVVAELDELPDDMVDGLDNVVFVTEDRPEDGSLDLLGLYDGVALTDRGTYGFGELPDRIILYREPHLAAVDDEDELRDEIHVTLVHEIAHFYGIDDAQLHELGWA